MSKKLIALAVIAAGVLAAEAAEVAAGEVFEADDALADKLIADGVAKPEVVETAKPKKGVKARVLVSCAFGEPNDVATLSAVEAKQAVADGLVDAEPAAVAYAESLKPAK